MKHSLAFRCRTCTHKICIFIRHHPGFPTNGPIYIGSYVDNFIFKEWFQVSLVACISAKFMEPAPWFLGIYLHWNVSPDGICWVYLSQAGFVHALLLKYELDRANSKTHYQSRLCTYHILKLVINASLDPDFV
jgi:hypothetical protein